MVLFCVLQVAAIPGNYLSMKGTVHTHSFHDQEDSLSVKEIVELQGDDGLPVWFGRSVRKVVCLTGECRIARLWLFWDGTGDYLGFQLYNDEELTKTDHDAFSPDDYRKLDRILRDSLSFIKHISQEDLVFNESLDGRSGATQPAYKEQLVEGAAYTCYSLWHTVYGNTRTKIYDIIQSRCDSTYLNKLLNSNNFLYRKWAVQYLIEHPQQQKWFDLTVFRFLSNEYEELALLALDYLNPEMLKQPDVQQEFYRLFRNSDVMRRFQIMRRLSQLDHVDENIVLYLLNQFDKQEISASSLIYVYKCINQEHLKNNHITKKLNKFLKHKNNFVRTITQQVYDKSHIQ